MRIVFRAVPRGEQLFTVLCKQCQSMIEFARKEAELVHDHRDGDFLKIDCPVCNGQITHYSDDPPKGKRGYT